MALNKTKLSREELLEKNRQQRDRETESYQSRKNDPVKREDMKKGRVKISLK